MADARPDGLTVAAVQLTSGTELERNLEDSATLLGVRNAEQLSLNLLEGVLINPLLKSALELRHRALPSASGRICVEPR